jgi:ParB-like chromosome segregation protein Spo0J
MIPTTSKNFPTSSIIIPRSTRQRTDLTESSVFSLAHSIAERQTLLQNIGVDGDTNEIIFGERRLTAVKLLHKLFTSAPAIPTIPGISPDEVAALQQLTLSPPSWSADWTKIPARVGKNLTPFDKEIFEFVENAHRQELPWQDKARAVHKIHLLGIEQSSTKWTAVDTARVIGLSPSMVSKYLDVWNKHTSGDDEIKSQIEQSETIGSALQLIARVASRTEPTLSFRKLVTPAPQPNIPSQPTTPQSKPISPDTPIDIPEGPPILNLDFIEFARTYSGPTFNFIHCDFPYGISYNTSASQGTAADTKSLGAYDDSEETYWSLCNALVSSSLIADSSHIMFWFSQNLLTKTKAFFLRNLPGCTIQEHLMIWHRPDNSGICPDPQRYGRRTYDTAMLISLGDRLIVNPRALSFSFPWSDKTHRSMKPVQVLDHFFSMFVDKHSRVLDPTCGSGTSLIAAKKAGAKAMLGLEKDERMSTQAASSFKNYFS